MSSLSFHLYLPPCCLGGKLQAGGGGDRDGTTGRHVRGGGGEEEGFKPTRLLRTPQGHKAASSPLTSSQHLPWFDCAHLIHKLSSTPYSFPPLVCWGFSHALSTGSDNIFKILQFQDFPAYTGRVLLFPSSSVRAHGSRLRC